MTSSVYQNAGPGRPPPPPPGTYRQNQQSQQPPPPPPGQYPSSNSYNYSSGGSGSGQAPAYGSNTQAGYNPNYGYTNSNASYGPPGVNNNQNQYPPLPSYSVPSQPPPPPPPGGSAPLPPPPPPPLPLSSAPAPPPPPPPSSHHGGQAYQEGMHNAYYPPTVGTQSSQGSQPPSSVPASYPSSTHTSSANVTSSQPGSAHAASSRQTQSSTNNWSTTNDANKTSHRSSSAYHSSKPGAPGSHDKVPGAGKLSHGSARPPIKAEHRVESEQEIRERKKREYERRKIEEQKKEAKLPSSSAHKFPGAGTPSKHNFAAGSKDPKAAGSKDKFENRLKRPSTFVCKVKFRNELPDPVSQPKLLQVNSDKDRYCKYNITSLEKTQKHRLIVDSDLGIPLDLLDISVYNAPKSKPPMDPEDEELLRDDEKMPSLKNDNIRKKDRPTDKGVAWLVKTQYISPVCLDPAKQALTEKQAKELKEMKEGKRDFLDTLNDRDQQIRSIQESFRVAQQTPVHQTKPGLKPVEVIPLLPDFERWENRHTHTTFDGEPTADSDLHRKLDPSVRDELEALAILKSYVLSDPETGKQERFLAYMVPKVEELHADSVDEMSYNWVREYHLEVRPEETQNYSTYVFTFGDDGIARYVPLQQKVSVQKKKAKERTINDGENAFAIPSRITVRRGEMIDDEEEERPTQRLTQGEVRGSQGSKRRQVDDGYSHSAKRRDSRSRAMSDDDEYAYE